MTTAIRSAVIELGIRQLQAKLIPPDVTQILQAQKALEQTGLAAEQAAVRATQSWSQFTANLTNLQSGLVTTDETFEKILADAVAWEETLPGIASGTQNATNAALLHSEAMFKEGAALSRVAQGTVGVTSGLLLMGVALSGDKLDEKLIKNLFLLQGLMTVTRSATVLFRGLAGSISLAAAASTAMALAASPVTAVVAVLAIAAYTAFKAFTATHSALTTLVGAFEKDSEAGEQNAHAFELQAQFAYEAQDKIRALNIAYGELYTNRLKLSGLQGTAEERGYYEEAEKLQRDIIKNEEHLLQVRREQGEAERYGIEQQIKKNDLKLQELRLAGEVETKERESAASLFRAGPEGRAKLQYALRAARPGGDFSALNEFQLGIVNQYGDENTRRLAEREGERRQRGTALYAIESTLPRDPDTQREQQVRKIETENLGLNRKADQVTQKLDAVLSEMVKVLEKQIRHLEQIEHASRVQQGVSWTLFPGF